MDSQYNSLIHKKADEMVIASGAKLTFDVSRAAITDGEVFLIAPFACKVTQVEESHTAAATAASTLDIQQGTTSVLSAAINLQGAANTVVNAVAASPAAIAAGTLIKFVLTGTPTGLGKVRVCVTLTMI